MTREDLMQRIMRMPYEDIKLLSATDIWKLTDCFNRELVKEIVAKKRTPESQVEAIVLMKNTRIMALEALKKPITKHPEYFEDWLFNIRTGVLVKATPPVSNVVEYGCSPSSNSAPKVETVAMASKVANDVADKFREFNTKVAELQARNKELEAQLQQATAENEQLKEQLEERRNQPKASDMQEDEWIVELLSHLMYENVQNAKDFLEKIRKMDDTEITDVVAEWVKDKIISSKSCRRDLWRILHAAKLYDGTESNYNTAMRNKL